MTTIITRLYSSHDDALKASEAVYAAKISRSTMEIVSGTADTAAAKSQIAALGVYPSAAATYASRVASGHALLVIHAGFREVYRTKNALSGTGDIDAGVAHTELFVSDPTKPREAPTRYLPEPFNFTVFTGDHLPYQGQTWLPFHKFFRFPLLSKREPRAGVLTNKLFSKMFGLPMTIKYRES
jgi:hypothetical protein